jgi:hypothetical protein
MTKMAAARFPGSFKIPSPSAERVARAAATRRDHGAHKLQDLRERRVALQRLLEASNVPGPLRIDLERAAGFIPGGTTATPKGKQPAGPGWFLAKVIGDVAQAGMDTPPGLANIAKAQALDWRDFGKGYLHGIQTGTTQESPEVMKSAKAFWRSGLFPRTRHIARDVSAQTYNDLRHPLRHPGNTLLAGISAATGGVTAASQLRLAGKAARRVPAAKRAYRDSVATYSERSPTPMRPPEEGVRSALARGLTNYVTAPKRVVRGDLRAEDMMRDIARSFAPRQPHPDIELFRRSAATRAREQARDARVVPFMDAADVLFRPRKPEWAAGVEKALAKKAAAEPHAVRIARRVTKVTTAPVVRPLRAAARHPVLGTAAAVESITTRNRAVQARERRLASGARLRGYPR